MALTFTALLPLVNPLGSALIFLGLAGNAPLDVYRALARRIAVNTVLFFATIDLVGSAILTFFGLSLPIVQFSGGLVIAAMAWSLLNQKQSGPSAEKRAAAAAGDSADPGRTLMEKTFYPFTFPVTAGPGCIVVMLTLSARIRQQTIIATLIAQAGTMIAVCLLAATVYLSYAYAPRVARSISPQTVHGILRVISFILLCIGVQIAWNGVSPLLVEILHAR